MSRFHWWIYQLKKIDYQQSHTAETLGIGYQESFNLKAKKVYWTAASFHLNFHWLIHLYPASQQASLLRVALRRRNEAFRCSNPVCRIDSLLKMPSPSSHLSYHKPKIQVDNHSPLKLFVNSHSQIGVKLHPCKDLISNVLTWLIVLVNFFLLINLLSVCSLVLFLGLFITAGHIFKFELFNLLHAFTFNAWSWTDFT